MVNKIIQFSQNVEILCKTIWKSPCINRANFRVKLFIQYLLVDKQIYTPTFPTFPTTFFTNPQQIASTNFSTIPQPLLLQLQNIFNRKNF